MELCNVYLSDNIIDESVDTLLRLARHKSMPLGYFTIVVSKKEDELLIMMGSSEINSDRFINADYHIVGFGKGKKETRELIRYIVDDVMHKTGDISREQFMTIRN